MNVKGIGLGLAVATCVALGARTAEAADCSDDTETLVDVAAAAGGLIPQLGPIVSAGISLGSTLACETSVRNNLDEPAEEPLTTSITELDNAFRTEQDYFPATSSRF